MGQVDDETKDAMSPRWIAPIVTWLASDRVRRCHRPRLRRPGDALAVAEGWHRGPAEHPHRGPCRDRRVVERLLAEPAPTPTCSASTAPDGGTTLAHQPRRRRRHGEPVELSWTSEDVLLYALGVGAGLDELAFTTENNRLPPARAPHPWRWSSPWVARAFSAIGPFNPAMLVHGEQGIALHRHDPRPEAPSRSASTDHRDLRQGQGRGGRSWRRPAPTTPRRAAVHHVVDGCSSAARAASAATVARPARDAPPERRARPRRQLPDPARPGAALPALRRPQPAALRPGVRASGRVRPPDPARPVHLRLHRPGAAARRSAARTRPASARWRAASPRRSSRVSSSRSRCGSTAASAPSTPTARTIASSSTAAATRSTPETSARQSSTAATHAPGGCGSA